MKVRRKREKLSGTPPSISNAFRTAERLFKARNSAPRIDLAFDSRNIDWEAVEIDGKVKGTWKSGTGETEICYRVPLEDLSGFEMGQSRWKGKAKETDYDWAVVIPRIPGLVIFPSILPEPLQRSLVVESLEDAKQPNVTSLDPHYRLPREGLWNAFLSGQGEQVVERIDFDPDQTTISTDGTKHASSNRGTSEDTGAEPTSKAIDAKLKEVTVGELVPKLRWANVGYHYNWTTKLYDFERPFVPIPPLMLRSCRTLARAMPWQHVFFRPGNTQMDEDEIDAEEWERWRTDYEPDAGIVNFYQAKDTLTGHTDHSEIDSVQPLVSLSLGLSSIFLVGGLTKDVPPLAILLRSGDGLIMSGRRGRRAYHGLPRVLENTLPDHLRARAPTATEGYDEGIEADSEESEWTRYGEYLERGARININLRSGTRGGQ